MKAIITCSFLKHWDDFYEGEIPEVWHESGKNIRINLDSPAGVNFHIKDSLFDKISSSHQGGAIYFSNIVSETKFLVEKSVLSECHSDISGGGVYFYGTGDCVFSQICGYKCTSSMHCFIIVDFLEVDKTKAYKNDLFTSSFCHAEEPLCTHAIFQKRGDIKHEEVNISSTKLKEKAFSCDPSFKSNCQYSSYYNNTVSTTSVLYLGGECGNQNVFNHVFTRCNVIKNVMIDEISASSIMDFSGKATVSNTCFISNKCIFLFTNYNQFKDVNGDAIIEDCYFDKAFEFYGEGLVIRNKSNDEFVHMVVYLNTAKCEAELKGRYYIKKCQTCKNHIMTKNAGSVLALVIITLSGGSK